MTVKSFLTKLGLAALLSTTANCTLPVTKPLHINTNEKHYSIEKSREEGEKDLKKLTGTERKEEAWFFAEYSNKKIWQEAGYKEWALGVSIASKLALPLINHDLESLSLYHFHSVLKDNFDTSQLPSKKDFIVCKDIMKDLDDFCLGYSDKFDCRIVVSTGVYTIKINSLVVQNQLEEFLFDDSLNEMEDRINDEINIAFARLPSDFNYYMKNKKNFAEQNKKFAEKYSNDLMKISFEPK